MSTGPFPPRVLARVRRSRCWRLTAYHEAGHAVAGLALGRAVRAVALFPVGDPDRRLGVCEYGRLRPRPWPMPQPRTFRRWIICSLAGGEGERLLAGVNSQRGRWADDSSVLDDALWACDGDSAQSNALLRRLERFTTLLLEANRPAVGRVAAALLASDRLRLVGREVADAACELTRLPMRATGLTSARSMAA